jgi:hypothetical protein
MRFRPLCSLLALALLVLASGCCHDRWCCRHPFAPRCRPACEPEPCGCCNPCGYPPVQSMPPPVFHAPLPPQ